MDRLFVDLIVSRGLAETMRALGVRSSVPREVLDLLTPEAQSAHLEALLWHPRQLNPLGERCAYCGVRGRAAKCECCGASR